MSSVFHVVNFLYYSSTHQDKLELFGTYRVAVGGRTPGEAESHRGVSSRNMTSVEPVFWHSRPLSLCFELLHSYNIISVLDVGASDGNWALACCLKRCPYHGFCCTETHLKTLTERVVCELLLKMLSSSEGIYEPKFAARSLGSPG